MQHVFNEESIMLQINLSRYSIQGETAEGQLYIEGCKICDTLEHAEASLPSGKYLVTLAHCKHFKRKMPLISPIDRGKRGLRDCSHCSALTQEKEGLIGTDGISGTNEAGRTTGTGETNEAVETADAGGLIGTDGSQSKRFILNNSCLPRFCPMIRPGNGVHHMQDGRLLVGERLVTGCITHPRAYFDQLVNRIKEQSRMKQSVVLYIRNLAKTEVTAQRSNRQGYEQDE